MSAFAVGEVVTLQRLIDHPELNGMEVIIESKPYKGLYFINFPGFEQWNMTHKRNLRKRRPPASDESAHRQAMLDCIERAKRVSEVAA